MPADVNHISVTFGNGIKREEYGPVKRAEVTIAAAIGAGEDYGVVLDLISSQAIAKVAFLLNAPRPETAVSVAAAEPALPGEPPARRKPGPKPKDAAALPEPEKEPAAVTEGQVAPSTTQPGTSVAPQADEEWTAAPTEADISDKQLQETTSAKSTALGGDDAHRALIKQLILSFSTRTDGPPFKVQEIPQAQRRDYLTKLAAIT